MRGVLLLVTTLCAACVVGDVDFRNKRCPCDEGWHCDGERRVCVEGPVPDAGTDDAAPPMDAGSGDSGLADAGRLDAGERDAGASDAEPPDAGPPDAGPDPTACDDALAGAIFCDGFESDDDFTAWTLPAREVDGVLTRVTDVVYRGEAALRSETTAPSGRAHLSAAIPNTTDGELWARVYAYVPASSDVTHFDILQVREDADPYDGVVVAMRDYTFLYVHEISMAAGMAPVATRDTWECYEIQVVVSNTAGEIRLFIDGAMVVEATGLDTLPPSGFGRFEVGLMYSSSLQPATAVYFDEAAVGTTRLPCDL